MSELITGYFKKLARIEGPVLTDISASEARYVTGANLANVLDRMAAVLAEGEVRSGDRVLALFDNTLESALLLLTAMRHGITLCLQPAGASEADLVKAEALASCSGRLNVSSKIVGGLAPLRIEELPAKGLAAPDLPPLTPFTITFTSGSTGAPKGIVHAAESLLACAEAFNRQTGITSKDRFLNVMPMYYMAGIFNGILAPLQAGAPVMIDSAFGTATAMRFWSVVRDNGITAMWLAPTMLSLAVRLDRTNKRVPEGFRRLFIGTGAMARAEAEAFMQTYGMPPLQSYGLSELLYITVDDADAPAFGSVGRLLDGVEVAFDDVGRLMVKTPYGFLGSLTQAGIEPPDRPFVTSDLAELSDGRLSIMGRSDDIIVRGGMNINPVELETLLAPLMPGRGFCVTGLPDDTLGQRVVLVIEGAAQHDDAETLATARRIILDRGGRTRIDELAHVKVLPVGPTGKIRRQALTAELSGSRG